MSQASTPPSSTRRRRVESGTSRAPDVAAFVAGGLAAALGIAVAELLAGLVAGAPSLVIAIADLVVDNQPPGAKELIVELFGTNNKLALNVGIVLASIAIAGLLGLAARRRWSVAVVGFGVAGAAGLVAALSQPLTDPLLAVITSVVSVSVALLALRLLLSATAPAWVRGTGPLAVQGAERAGAMAEMPDWDRRRFLQVGGGVAVSSVVLGVVGRNLLAGGSGGAVEGATLPAAAAALPEVPAGAALDVEGLTPIVTPNDKFFTIHTAMVSPRVDVLDWQLTIKGMVDREIQLSYEELSELPLFDQYVTIACVSNEVGGRLVGNALWTGVDLRDVLDMAGVQPDATQIVGRSVDGFTAGFPTAWAMDPQRRPMIALGMNGAPLPIDHGYPARLIIPGLYGYVSATKWLSEIELTTWEAFDGFWVPIGWAKEAPILTQSRIDVPSNGSTVASAAAVAIAGVAWAPDRGVRAVEVAIDDGEWQPAELSAPLNDATWVQWKLPWVAPAAGEHRISVRATDGTGAVQTDEVTAPAPDGARGHHSVRVTVA